MATCQHNLAVTNSDGRGCIVCAQNRSMVEHAFVLLTGLVGRWVKVTGPMGGSRVEFIDSVSGTNADDAVVMVRATRGGDLRAVRGFDIAFRWSGFHVAPTTARR